MKGVNEVNRRNLFKRISGVLAPSLIPIDFPAKVVQSTTIPSDKVPNLGRFCYSESISSYGNYKDYVYELGKRQKHWYTMINGRMVFDNEGDSKERIRHERS
jgi:hypothetical protein